MNLTTDHLALLAALADRGDAGLLIVPGSRAGIAAGDLLAAGLVCVGGRVVDANRARCRRVRITMAGKSALIMADSVAVAA